VARKTSSAAVASVPATQYRPEKYPRLRNDYKKIQVELNGCWTWLGGDIEMGVAYYIYGLLNDSIPKGSKILLDCGNANCVCPFHMQVQVPRFSYDFRKTWAYVPPMDPTRVVPQELQKPKRAPATPQLKKVVQPPPPKHVPAPIIVPPKPVVVAPVIPQPITPALPTCHRGHPMTPENTLSKSNRGCRICKQARDREFAANKRFQKNNPGQPYVPPPPPPVVKSCQRGHPQTTANQYVYPDGLKKECLICKGIRDKARKEKLKAAR